MRIAAGVLLSIGCAGIFTTSVHAQTLGGMGAAAGMSATLSGIGAGVAGGVAMQRARQTGQPGAGSFIEDGGMMPQGGQAGAAGQAAGQNPAIPDPNTAAAAPLRRPAPIPYNRNISGENVIAQLLRSSPTAGRATPTRQARSSRQSAQQARRVAQSTPAQRQRAIQQKYQKPPVGWLSYYLKDDRYKVTSKVWNYVTIEDDQGRYPVRYYYSPSSPRMLTLLSQSPRNVRRANRVIGFRTWQDAIAAGYLPDPVSQPAPAPQIVNLARLTRGPMLARYVEFVYSGQITPTVFDANYRYFQSVAQTVNADRRTRPLLSRAVNLAVGAAIGENAPPSSITITRRTVTSSTTATTPGVAGAPTNPNVAGAAAAPQGAVAGEKRTEDFDTAKNRFGNLAAR